MASKYGKAVPVSEGKSKFGNAVAVAAPQKQNMLQKADQAFQSIPGVKQAAEIAGGFNRGVGGMVDTFVTKPLNTIGQAVGIDRQIPSAQAAAAPKGAFTGPGLQADILGAAGETAAMGVAAGGALRTAANAIPQAAQSVGANVMRQMGRTTVAADASMGATSGAGAVVGEKVGGKPGAFIGALAAPALPSLIKASGAEIVRQMFRGSSSNTKLMEDLIADAARAGTSLNVGEATGRRSMQVVQNTIGRFAGGGPMTSAAEKSAASINNRLASIADDLSTSTGAAQAGRVIKEGITGSGGFLDRFKGQSALLWDKVDSAIGMSTQVPMANTKTVLDDLVSTDALGKILNSSKIVEMKTASDGLATAQYETLRALRSKVGEQLGSTNMTTDIQHNELKRLYGAITEDIKAAAAASGNDATRLFARANNYSRAGHTRIDGFLNNIMRKEDFAQVFSAVTRGGDGSQVVNAFKRSMKPDEWNVVASNVVRELGTDADGAAWTVDKFVRDWTKLGPAKKALFSGSRTLDHYGRDLDAIARTAQVIKKASVPGSNSSNTAQTGANIGAGAGIVLTAATGQPLATMSIIATIGANNLGARLMTSPRFVSWLAGTTRGPQDMGAQLAKLAAIQQSLPLENAIAVDSLIQELSKDKTEN